MENLRVVTVKDRIKVFIKDHLGISVQNFEKNCGLSNGAVNSMRKGFGHEALNKVLCTYPELNKYWLTEGEGEMLRGAPKPYASDVDGLYSEPKRSKEFPAKVEDDNRSAVVRERIVGWSRDRKDIPNGIPYYEEDAKLIAFDTNNVEASKPSYYIDVQSLNDCDCAVQNRGTSMDPEFKNGDVIALKEVTIDEVLPGEAYLIITAKYRTVKYLRRMQDDDSRLRLVPHNLKEYDESYVLIDKIKRIFLVKGSISVRI